MTGDANPVSPATDDVKRIEDITRIVQKVLASERRAVHSADGRAARLVKSLGAYWPQVVGVVSIILAIVAWVGLDVSPLESAREIAHRKQQSKYQQELSKRHIELGNDFLNVSQLQAAKVEFTRARDLDAYSIEAELGLLKVSVFEPVAADEYDPEIAERRLQAVLRQNPHDTHALAFLGDVYRNIDSDKALDYYDQALASDGTNAFAYYGKGVLFDLKGKTADALAMYEKAASLSAWNQTFLNNLAYQYYLRSDYRKAQELYIRLLSLDGRYFLSYCMLANSLLMQGQVGAAYNDLLLLDATLKDGASAKLTRNQGEWFFHVDEKATIHLYSSEEKTVYARYLMALAAQLLGRDPDVQRHLSEARASGLTDTSVVQSLLNADISRLAKARPGFATQLLAFSAALRTR